MPVPGRGLQVLADRGAEQRDDGGGVGEECVPAVVGGLLAGEHEQAGRVGQAGAVGVREQLRVGERGVSGAPPRSARARPRSSSWSPWLRPADPGFYEVWLLGRDGSRQLTETRSR